MSVKPLRTDLSCPSRPRKSMSASISTLMPSMGTSNSAALAALPEVRQPANEASSVSAAVAAASTPPRPGGASTVMKKRRVGATTGLPTVSCNPTSTRALAPRRQVERSFTVRLPSAGFSRTFRSISFMPSTSTSLSPRAMGCPPGLGMLQIHLQGCVDAVAELSRGHRHRQLDQLTAREVRGQRRVERVVDVAGEGQLLGVADDEPLDLAVRRARQGVGQAVELRRGEADPAPDRRMERVADGGLVQTGDGHEGQLSQARVQGQ